MAKETKRKRRANGDGSIYKDGDGYRVQVLLGYNPATGDPLVRKVRVKSHADAVEKLKELQSQAYQGKLSHAGSPTLEAYVARWLTNRKPVLARATFEQYTWILQTHILPTLGRKRVDHIQRSDVQALVASLAKQRVKSRAKDPVAHEAKRKKKAEKDGVPYEPIVYPFLSRRTLQLSVAVLHAVFQDAIRDNLRPTNPCDLIELPKQPKKQPKWLTQEEVNKLFHALDESVRDIVLFMLGTGARVSEARGLRWEDVDFNTGVVRIAGQLESVDGELVYRPTTKTNRDRSFWLSPHLRRLLEDLRSRQLLGEIKDPDGIVFLNPYGRRFHCKFVWTHLQKACKTAEIKAASSHVMRHTASTHGVGKTGDLHGVGKLIGHAQVSLTSDLYSHADADRLRPVTDALGEMLDDAEKSQRPNDA